MEERHDISMLATWGYGKSHNVVKCKKCGREQSTHEYIFNKPRKTPVVTGMICPETKQCVTSADMQTISVFHD